MAHLPPPTPRVVVATVTGVLGAVEKYLIGLGALSTHLLYAYLFYAINCNAEYYKKQHQLKAMKQLTASEFVEHLQGHDHRQHFLRYRIVCDQLNPVE